MPRYLLLTLDGPLQSYGGPAVDQNGVIDPFPATALLTGLIANALGWTHGETDRLQALQDRLVHAALRIDPGDPLVDFQTADLGQPFLDDALAWTTRGRPERRKGGSAAAATTIRHRHYRAGALTRVALTLDPETAAGGPDLGAVAAALVRPARPLFLGRKTCLPAAPLVDPAAPGVEAADLLDALAARPVGPAGGAPPNDPASRLEAGAAEADGRIALSAQWPAPPAGPEIGDRGHATDTLTVVDRRDWANQIHGGSRPVCRGRLWVPRAADPAPTPSPQEDAA
jgi:CRISPR system Cascade subunit CasD